MKSRSAVMCRACRKSAVAAVLVAGVAFLSSAAARTAMHGLAQHPGSDGPGDPAAPQRKPRLGLWLRGVVVDEQGKPVSGTTVSPLLSLSPESVTSRADGSFVLARNAPSRVEPSFLATADGGARQGILRLTEPSAEHVPRRLVRIVLRPALSVTVTVVDGSGAPVPDAAVVAQDRSWPVAQGRTDARGIVELKVPAEANMHWIIAARPGVGFDYTEIDPTGHLTSLTRPTRRARLVLDGARTVRIRAADAAGHPVAGVELKTSMIYKKGKFGEVHCADFPFKIRTDENGIATVDWLPAGLHGLISFHSNSPPYFVTEWPTIDAAKPQTELTATVLRATRVSGRVTLPGGAPAPDILVEAHGQGGRRAPLNYTARTRTAADGSYAIDVRPELSYMIGVTDDGWAARTLTGVAVREGTPRTGLNLSLERGTVVRGRVAYRRDGKSAPGRTLRLAEHGPRVPPALLDPGLNGIAEEYDRFAHSDEDGRFAFRVGPGKYSLIGPASDGWELGDLEPLQVVAGQDVERDFPVPRQWPPPRPIRGLVRSGDAPRLALAEAVVRIGSHDDRFLQVAGFADNRGRFELPCPGGQVVLYARTPAGRQAGYTVFDREEGREPTIVAVAAAIARGRVVDEHGKPWASLGVGYSINAGHQDPNKVPLPAIIQEVVTDEEGRFTVPGLPVGTWCIVHSNPPGGTELATQQFELKDARPIDLAPLVVKRAGPLPEVPDPH